MKRLAGLAIAASMALSAFVVLNDQARVVGADESSTIWGAANCVERGTFIPLCNSSQTCDVRRVPPQEGGGVGYYNNGAPTDACYKPGGPTPVTCPCGTTTYTITGTNSASCFTGS